MSTLRGPAQLADLQGALCVPLITLHHPLPWLGIEELSRDIDNLTPQEGCFYFILLSRLKVCLDE